MTPAARLQAAIGILDTLGGSAAPADGAIRNWGRNNRYAGSGDRRAIGDQVYVCLREKGRLAAAMQSTNGRALVLGALRLIDAKGMAEIDALFSGVGHAPKPVTPKERERLEAVDAPEGLGLPAFLEQELRASFGDAWEDEAKALLQTRAPVDIRINALKATTEEVQADIPVTSARTPLSAWGLRLDSGADFTTFDAYAKGTFEVQDEGSQIAAFLAASGVSGTVIDYCAGGGGKSLALLQTLEGANLVACDVNEKRLDAVRGRLARVGLKAGYRPLGKTGQGTDDLIGKGDLVLVDAPCSGSGTWRRKPEAAWRTGEGEILDFAELQGQVLERASALVKPGGRLAYVTCSVLNAENRAVVDAFAAAHADFAPVAIDAAALTPALTDAARGRLAELSAGGHTVQLSPLRTGTDGFFIALFEKRP